MSKLLAWLIVSFSWYTNCVYATPPTVTCGGGLPCAVNWATPAVVARTATPSARRMENVIGCLPSWGIGLWSCCIAGGNESTRVTPRRGVCNEPVTDAGGVPERGWATPRPAWPRGRPAAGPPRQGPRARQGASARRAGRPAVETGAPGSRGPPAPAPTARSSPAVGRAPRRRDHHRRPAQGAGACAPPPPPPPRPRAARSRLEGRADLPGAAA